MSVLMCDILYLEEQTIGNRFFHMVLRGAELVTSQAPYFFTERTGIWQPGHPVGNEYANKHGNGIGRPGGSVIYAGSLLIIAYPHRVPPMPMNLIISSLLARGPTWSWTWLTSCPHTFGATGLEVTAQTARIISVCNRASGRWGNRYHPSGPWTFPHPLPDPSPSPLPG